MRDTYTSENHRDFNARYANTYGWLIQPNKRSLVYLLEGDEEQLTFNTGGAVQYTAYINGGAEFEFIPINMGWFNSDNENVIFLERNPTRQWKRGICETNTRLYTMTRYGPDMSALTYARLASIYLNPINITKEYIESRLAENKSVALSEHFVLGDNQRLYFYRAEIGARVGTTLMLDNAVVQQELSDCIRRLSLPWSVSV